ncbi:dTDP-glucose 4,6-dehydratase [Candidatus Nitronereus thalassa]|uniref:dTDP-glucose 4,6-dehydratase n=1 Tax=Candidatus Nitronereus thalassa TaxID=3020898 RepID=A0ABU3KC34_9BACT|nr:dTDP-glucose 4,6-dehydratase [Candidatus Nitronereus thalassa]MDT7044069.1 dTDP-glucose 4,6-dehydratase [Candidatus Nitronereus thalassa]
MSGFTPRTILVTGGAGFIGSNFVRYVLYVNNAVKVVNLDALTYAGSEENLVNLPDPNRHTFVHGDICDHDLVSCLLQEHAIDTIVHFAAESHVDRSIAGPEAFIRTNVQGTFTLLEEARKYWLEHQHWDEARCRFHHISTDEVYGTLGPGDPPFTETTSYAPNSPYSASKAAADHFVRAYQHTYLLPTTTTNCSNNYGPYQHSEKFMPTVIRACLKGQPIPVYGDGSNFRDWLYVEDHCVGIWKVIEKGRIGETYNIGGSNHWSNLDIATLLCRTVAKVTGETPDKILSLISFVKDRPGHDWRYAIDSRKIQTELGWQPAHSFEDGIRKTVEWYWERNE